MTSPEREALLREEEEGCRRRIIPLVKRAVERERVAVRNWRIMQVLAWIGAITVVGGVIILMWLLAWVFFW